MFPWSLPSDTARCKTWNGQEADRADNFCCHMDPATAEHLAFCEAWATECSARDARDTGRPTRPDAYVIAIRYPKCMQCFLGDMHARLADRSVGANFPVPLSAHSRRVCNGLRLPL